MLVSNLKVLGALAFAAILVGVAVAQAQNGESAEARLQALNIVLPPPPKPIGNYVEWTKVGNLLFLSGHGTALSKKGKVGADVTIDEARQAARQVGLGLLATTRDALGTLDKVRRVVKVFGMVNSAPGFGEQPQVIDGCSDLLVQVFGEARGKGARSAVGMAELPRGIPVEIEMILEVAE